MLSQSTVNSIWPKIRIRQYAEPTTIFMCIIKDDKYSISVACDYMMAPQ